MRYAGSPWRAIAFLAVAATIAAAVSGFPRTVAAQGTVTPPPMKLSPIPSASIAPSATPTLPPASASLQIPYPAYGTPAPNVTAGYSDSTVPQTINLHDAIMIAVARSPLLASARAAVDLARANVSVARVPALPSLFGVKRTTAHTHRTAGR